MIKKQIIEQEVSIYICDKCGKESYARLGYFTCEICGQLICRDCAVLFNWETLKYNSFEGDYPNSICKECWQKGHEEREELLKLKEEYDQKEKAIINKWKNKLKDLENENKIQEK